MTIDVSFARIPEFTLGDRLRKARESADLKQEELAAEIGVHRNTVRKYEGELVSPRRPILIAWAMRTGVPLEWLETGKTPTPDGPGGGDGLLRLDLNQRPSD